MEKGPDQTVNQWQRESYEDETTQLGQIDRYVKEGVTFLVCSLYLFTFWLVISHTAWTALKLYQTDWVFLPQIIKALPYKKLITFSTVITGLATLINCLYKKFQLDQNDFPLLKLFPKNAARKFLDSSRIDHE
jgi:hypothetical protein